MHKITKWVVGLLPIIFFLVYANPVQAAVLASFTNDTGNNGSYGATNFQKSAQPFTVGINGDAVTSISVRIQNQGSPAGNTVVQLYTNVAGNPGVLLETCTAITATASYTDVTSTCAGTTVLLTAVTYWLVLSMSTANSGTNFYNWRFGSSPVYANALYFDGAIWNTGYGNFNGYFTVNGSAPASTPAGFITSFFWWW